MSVATRRGVRGCARVRRRCRRRNRRSGPAALPSGCGKILAPSTSARPVQRPDRRWRAGSRPRPRPTGPRSRRCRNSGLTSPRVRDGRGARAVALVVGHHGEVDLARPSAPAASRSAAARVPQVDHRRAGLDALPGRAADAGLLAGAGLRVGVDVHARHAEASCPPGLAERVRRRQCGVGRRAARADARESPPTAARARSRRGSRRRRRR